MIVCDCNSVEVCTYHFIVQGKAGNTYEAGKLNLLRYKCTFRHTFQTFVCVATLLHVCLLVHVCSLLQLWNCALQVMRDRFRDSKSIHVVHFVTLCGSQSCIYSMC